MLGFKKLNLTQNLMILAACGNAALATSLAVNTKRLQKLKRVL